MRHIPVPVSWTDADSYEPYSGRWSRSVAAQFVPWIDVDPGSRWIEPGCGTGALTSEIVSRTSPTSLRASDPSEPYLTRASESLAESVASFSLGRAEAIDAPDASADATVTGLVLNFVDDLAQALVESRRVTRPGGLVGAYIWDYSGEMWSIRHFWDVAILLDPIARRLHEGRRFATWIPDELVRRFREAGLTDVEVEPIVIDLPYRDFDDYWEPMLGSQGAGPTYIASLEPAAVEALRDAVRSVLPLAGDGSIPLTARAWAVRSSVPETSSGR